MKTTTKEAAHDTRLLELHGEIARAERLLTAAVERAFRTAARERGGEIHTVTEDGTRAATVDDLPADLRAELEPLAAALVAAVNAAHEHEESYTGWDRYWLVTTSNGHVHAHRACRTLRATTGLALMPTLSGKTADEAIALLGNTMCTVCFPDAPVDPVTIPAKVAKVLMDEGEDAFLKAMTKHTEAKATKVKCAGSGTRNYTAQRFPNGALRKYQRCEACGAAVTVTTVGLLRAHTPAKRESWQA